MPVRTIIGYYKSWESSAFPPKSINVKNVYTHINYAFLGTEEDGRLCFLNHNDEDIVSNLNNLKKENADLKLLFSVGGAHHSANFSSIAADKKKRYTLADSALCYLKKYNFDGVDIDWEFPGPTDKDNFVALLKTLRKKLNSEHLLTVAVSALANDPQKCYDVPKINQYVNFINVMTYDFHLPSEEMPKQNSPLYESETDGPWRSQNCNCSASLKNWENAGAQKDKLVLGLAFYGQCFRFTNSWNHVGSMSYKEIAKLECGPSKWTVGWDRDHQVPYKYFGNYWIGFDNPQSVAAKMRYVRTMRYGGVMIWTINDDNGDLGETIQKNKVKWGGIKFNPNTVPPDYEPSTKDSPRSVL